MSGGVDDITPAMLRTVRAVLDGGSFSEAGRRLGYTASAISQQIGALERHLGVRLFERTRHSLVPTDAGRALGVHADVVLSDLHAAVDDMRAHAAGLRGSLRIGTSGSQSIRLLPRALARLRASAPETLIQVDDNVPTAVGVQRLRDRSLDFALIEQYDGGPMPDTSGLSTRPLIEERMFLICTATDDRYREHGIVRLEDWSAEAWIAGRADTGHDRALRAYCLRHGFEPDVVFRSDNFDVLRGCIAERMGITLLPVLALGVDRDLSMRPLPDDAPKRRVLMAWRSSSDQPVLLERVREAFETAADNFLAWTFRAFNDRLSEPIVQTFGERAS